jgi:hypothetical protein
MTEDKTQCSVCGADLEGSDVYEGLCRKCREDQILGRPPSARKPPRPVAPPPLRPAAPPPLKPSPASGPGVIAIETDVEPDADTREMLVLKEAAAAPPAPEAPQGGEAASIRFVELQRPVEEFIVLEEGAEAPGREEPAPRPAEAAARLAPPAEAKPLQVGPPSPEPQFAPEPPVLKLRPEAVHAEPDATERAALAQPTPSLGAPHTFGRQAPPRPAPKSEEPGVLTLRAPEDRPKPRLAAEAPLSLQERKDSVELRALLERLAHDVEEVSARLRGSAGLSTTPGQQIGFGFRAFFGFLLGASLFALTGVGILGLAGYLFYPPALALLKRLVSSLLGTP